jgi:polyphosphate kinase 2 (PPK2 family)
MKINPSTQTSKPVAKRNVAAADKGPSDGFTPGERVDRLISDIQTGKVKYSPEIQAKIRPQELTLGDFPCHKYILKAGETDNLPTEIVAKGEKSKYKGATTLDSKLTTKENVKDLEKRNEAIADSINGLYAQKTESLMVLLEGDNAAGKDGMVKHVFTINPMTTNGQVAFKGANEEERKHEPNWRIMKNLAGPGQIMFHNRSHYGDVVFAAKTPEDKARRLAEIKELEYGLTMGLPMTAEGRIALPDQKGNVDPAAIQRPPMRFIKVLLGVSKEEQALRLAERLEDDAKVYKVTAADLEGHPKHAEIQGGFADAMAAGSSEFAPTYYLPNDNKVTGWRKLAEIADRVLDDMAPVPPGNKDGMSLEDRQTAAQALRKEAEKKLRG